MDEVWGARGEVGAALDTMVGALEVVLCDGFSIASRTKSRDKFLHNLYTSCSQVTSSILCLRNSCLSRSPPPSSTTAKLSTEWLGGNRSMNAAIDKTPSHDTFVDSLNSTTRLLSVGDRSFTTYSSSSNFFLFSTVSILLLLLLVSLLALLLLLLLILLLAVLLN